MPPAHPAASSRAIAALAMRCPAPQLYRFLSTPIGSIIILPSVSVTEQVLEDNEMKHEQIISGLAALAHSSEGNSESILVLETIAGNVFRDTDKRNGAPKSKHEELDKALSELEGVERAAPQWAHDLLDWIWDLFS